nr:MAG TPA: hypothetical protein [Caudoviricetes sp.]
MLFYFFILSHLTGSNLHLNLSDNLLLPKIILKPV